MSTTKDTSRAHTSLSGWLVGQMLIAMPGMPDPRFARSVVLLCSHGPEGAMGLILNRVMDGVDFGALLGQLNIAMTIGSPELPVHFGGPVEQGRGFVLHSLDYKAEGVTTIGDGIALSSTIEILQELAEGRGPARALLALGYAGWSPGQLEQEIQGNGWLVAPASEAIVFDADDDTKWDRAMAELGVSPLLLSGDIGHA